MISTLLLNTHAALCFPASSQPPPLNNQNSWLPRRQNFQCFVAPHADTLQNSGSGEEGADILRLTVVNYICPGRRSKIELVFGQLEENILIIM